MNDADISVHERNSTPEKSGAAGIHLFTASTLCHADTEVLVRGYEEVGHQLVYRLRRMYGFVIWDKVNRLFGAQDMFGIKPLYYSPPFRTAKGFCSAADQSLLEHPLFSKGRQ